VLSYCKCCPTARLSYCNYCPRYRDYLYTIFTFTTSCSVGGYLQPFLQSPPAWYDLKVTQLHIFSENLDISDSSNYGHMARGGHRLPKVSRLAMPNPSMPNPSMPCGQATLEMALWPFPGWPACRMARPQGGPPAGWPARRVARPQGGPSAGWAVFGSLLPS
jgi:hypothetical protein